MQTHERKPSCQKTGADAQNIPIRGRLKGHRLTFIRRLQCATWAFADRKQLRRRNMVCKRSPRYPEREYFAHLDRKSDNMPPENPEGTPGSRDDTPQTQARTSRPRRADPWGRSVGWTEQTSIPPSKEGNEAKGHPPARVEPNSNALNKLRGL